MYTFFKEIYFSKKIGLLLCCCHDVVDLKKYLLFTSKVTKETKAFFGLFVFFDVPSIDDKGHTAPV